MNILSFTFIHLLNIFTSGLETSIFSFAFRSLTEQVYSYTQGESFKTLFI